MAAACTPLARGLHGLGASWHTCCVTAHIALNEPSTMPTCPFSIPSVIRRIAAASLLSLLGPGANAQAQPEGEIRIAHVYSKTGPLEAYGKQTQTGFMMGLDHATGYGAVIGSVLFVLAQSYLLWLGVLFVLSVYRFPSGVVGRLRALRRRG